MIVDDDDPWWRGARGQERPIVSSISVPRPGSALTFAHPP
jgi:hypothetical protein